jgi:hypothetical protein
VGKGRKEVRYPGMVHKPGPERPSALTIERSTGRPDLLHIGINATLAAPHQMMYVDHVEVRRVRDGVRMLFGKLHPNRQDVCVRGLEVSVPMRTFVNHVYKSFTREGPGGSFHRLVAKAVEQFRYERIAKLETTEFREAVAAIRSNFVFMALHEDDAAIDFFHLDAATLQSVLQGGPVPEDFRGLIRVAVSPPLLLYFLDECAKVAEDLKRENPQLDDGQQDQALEGRP